MAKFPFIHSLTNQKLLNDEAHINNTSKITSRV